MHLGTLIAFLSHLPPERVVKHGFHRPHSHRGDYSQLAFEPIADVTIGSMFECAKSALDQEFHGYKGGVFRMGQYADVFIAPYGECGTEVTDAYADYAWRVLPGFIDVLKRMEVTFESTPWEHTQWHTLYGDAIEALREVVGGR